MSAHTMSPDLIAFLKDWYDWATNGAPEGKPFWRRHGLCPNVSALDWDSERIHRLHEELSKTLSPAEDTATPFGHSDYWERYDSNTQHECPKRLAWVRERLIEAGELRNCDDCGFSTTERNVTVCPDRACRGSVA